MPDAFVAVLQPSIRQRAAASLEILNPVWRWIYRYRGAARKLHLSKFDGDRASVFARIYESGAWNSSESVSGRGSEYARTAPLRRGLPRLLRELGVRSMLDAPCGDFNWMQFVALPEGLSYTGGDIVAEMITRLSASHASPSRTFVTLDIVADPIPAADFWLCRDVLFHLPERDVMKVLIKAARSDIRYFACSNHDFVLKNRDGVTGGYRDINMLLPPFSLPAPRFRIEDFVVPSVPQSLLVWERDQIAAAVEAFNI